VIPPSHSISAKSQSPRPRAQPRPRPLPRPRPASAGVLVIAVTIVASVATPPVVPTALMLQKAAIATAAIVLANSPPGGIRS
jgi:hypothetical protein